MMQFRSLSRYLPLGAAVVLLLGNSSTTFAQELRFMCSSDNNECEVIDDLLDGFEADNEGITVAMDIVPYSAILESLPVQLAAGTGPDIAKVTDLGGLNKYYLNIADNVDTEYWESAFGDTLDWYRASDDDDGLYGLHSQLTITGAYINKTLFDQAEVAVPGADASWDDWAEASREVAEITGVPFAMAMDRSGHRIAGPAISNGAQLFDDSGEPMLVDEGFTGYVQKFVDWHNDGTMARDVWAGSGGTSYQDAAQEFINGELVFYYSGSWQVNRMETAIGDAFDWQVIGTPCGPAACSGMPGGSGIVGFSDTEHPEAVAKVIDYFAQQPQYTELTARTMNIPAHSAVAEAGVDYEGASPAANAALNAWGAQVSTISPIAYAYQGYKNNRAMFNITLTRVAQAIVGELSVDEAMDRARDDLTQAMAETGK